MGPRSGRQSVGTRNPGGKMTVPQVFPGRLAVQQRVLPAYRAPFFEALAAACRDGLSVFAGRPQSEEQIPSAERLTGAELVWAENRNFLQVGSPFYQCWQPGLISWLEHWQPEALIVEANPRYRSTPDAVRWMHARSRPVLGWGLGAPPISGPLAGLRLGARRKFLAHLDGMIAYSRKGADEYIQAGFRSECVFVAPNAAARRPAHPPPQRPAILSHPAEALFVGRLQRRKRIDNLLRACAALPETLQPKLRVAGDGPARAEFEALAKEVYPATEFLGAQYGVDLEESFRRADLFVLPGTGGLAVQQAMSYALPVIVAEGDGTQSDLVRPENGWTVPPDDLPALEAALRQALSDGERLRRMGKESYRIVAEEISVERMVTDFVDALNLIISK